MRKHIIITSLLACATLIIAACSPKQGADSPLQAGSVWQNGEEIYIVEDSTSFWQLYGGNLHEGGFEMKLTKDGKWLVPTITDNHQADSTAGTWKLDGNVILLTANNNTTSRLTLVDGLNITSRDDMAAKALPALDSVQQINVYRTLEGIYKDQNGKKWVFSGNTMKRQGLGTAEPYSVGKSLDMNDSVIFTTNIAYAYSIGNNQVNLFKTEYVDSLSVWKYDKKQKPVIVLNKAK